MEENHRRMLLARRRILGKEKLTVNAQAVGGGKNHLLRHDELLGGRTEQRATLLAEPDNTTAYRAYVKWGWRKVSQLRPHWPDAPLFDVLMLPLPLPLPLH